MAVKIHSRERTAILSSLAAGVVPSIGLHHIQVGRKDEVGALLLDLKRAEDSAAFVRFVVGRFGSGKTFFLNLIRSVALERKFVVARADITTQRRLHGTQGQARGLYCELMRNLGTRSRPEGGALQSIIERWVTDVVHASPGEAAAAKIRDACDPLREFVGGHDFAKVIEQYYRGFAEHNDALQEAAVRWMRGEYASKADARKDLGVRTIIDDGSFYDALKLFAGFIQIAGYGALLVQIDELVVLSHRLNNKIARHNNYEAILRVVNDCLQGSVSGLGFIFAATDDCLNDRRRGLFSYEALATRLAPNRFATEGIVDFSGPVLHLPSLTAEDCFVLLHNVRRVHANGDESRFAIPDEGIEFFLNDCNRRMGAASFLTPRETVKDFVGLLSVLEQNRAADWRALIGAIKTSATDARDPDENIQAVQDDDEAVVSSADDDLQTFRL